MSPEIPLFRLDRSFAAYDLDRSGGLSPAELDRVVDGQVFQILSSALNPSEIASWLGSLAPDKARRVLDYFSSGDAAAHFARLYRSDGWAAFRLLGRARESASEPDSCRGGTGARYLAGLAEPERRVLLAWTAAFDPLHARRLGLHLSGARTALCEADREARMDVPDVSETLAGPARLFQGRLLSAVDRRRTVVIPMRAYASASAAGRDFLLTADVSTCLVLSLYDPETRRGVLAHFDVGSDLHNSVDNLLSELAVRGVPSGRLEARLVGGNDRMGSSRAFRADLEERLVLEGARFREIERGSEGDRSRAFALDLRTGELYEYQGPVLAPDPPAGPSATPSLLRRILFSD